MQITYKQALIKYKSGKWSVEVPPVQTTLWNDEAWVYWIFKIRKEEVEVEEAVNLKKLRKEYDKNEDKNYHSENYLLLAKAFGTSTEVKKVEEILKRNKKQGSTSTKDRDWMYKNINKYYDKIRKEKEGTKWSKQ